MKKLGKKIQLVSETIEAYSCIPYCAEECFYGSTPKSTADDDLVA